MNESRLQCWAKCLEARLFIWDLLAQYNNTSPFQGFGQQPPTRVPDPWGLEPSKTFFASAPPKFQLPEAPAFQQEFSLLVDFTLLP